MKLKNKDFSLEIQNIRTKNKITVKLILKNKRINIKDLSELMSILRKAFDINYEAHLSRNRFSEHKQVADIMCRKIEWHQARVDRNRLYEHKIRLLKKAIDLIEEKELNIDYGLKDDILFFKFWKEMITFHTVGKIECKSTDIVWDWKGHRDFPFRY